MSILLLLFITDTQSQLLTKLSLLLAKSLRIDELTARCERDISHRVLPLMLSRPLLRYYLEETGGDVKRAVDLARNDDAWEHAESVELVSSRRRMRHFMQRALKGQA